jgi:hypothetical protein
MHQMRLPKTAHTSRPWRVHEFTGDFELEDYGNCPPQGRDDLARLVKYRGLSVGTMTIVAPIAAVAPGRRRPGAVLNSLYPIVTIALARTVLDEQMTPRHGVGAGLALTGRRGLHGVTIEPRPAVGNCCSEREKTAHDPCRNRLACRRAPAPRGARRFGYRSARERREWSPASDGAILGG